MSSAAHKSIIRPKPRLVTAAAEPKRAPLTESQRALQSKLPAGVDILVLEKQAKALGYALDNPKDLTRLITRIRQVRVQMARQDPSDFNAYVLRDEQTDKPIKQAPMHKEWHDLLTDNDRLVIWSHVEAGKTQQIAIGRALYELGKNPLLRICIISNTNDLAKKIVRQAGQYIQKSVQLHEVFPHLIPTSDPSLPWKSQALTIERPGMGSKDASIQATGMHGNIIGSRIDLLILDDVLDPENTNTPGPRDDAYRWLKFITGRLTQEGRVWAITNAWHPDDAMHRLEKDGFLGKRFPVIRPDGSLTWPAVWPHKRIEKARGPGGMGPLEFARQLMCQARDDTSARFKREWIDNAIERGRGLRLCQNLEQLLREAHVPEEEVEDIREKREASEAMWRLTGHSYNGGIVTGVDLAVQKHSAADETVLFTIYVSDQGDRRILSIRSGKWSGPEILNEIKKCYDDYGGMFLVENNAAQAYIVQQLQATTAIPVMGHTTGRNKADPAFGIEGVATELANGKWLIPNALDPATGQPIMDSDVQKWITELLFFDPREHTGDRVMAGWLAREAARRFVDPHVNAGEIHVRTFRPRTPAELAEAQAHK